MALNSSRTLRSFVIAAAAGTAIVGITVAGAGAASAAPMAAQGHHHGHSASSSSNATSTYAFINGTGRSLTMKITNANGDTYQRNIAGRWEVTGDFDGVNKITMTYEGQSAQTVVFEGTVAHTADGGWQRPVITQSKIVIKSTTGANGSIIAVS